MARYNYPIKLGELLKEVQKAIVVNDADKYVLLSNDEEGNGYHECYFGFEPAEEYIDENNGFRDINIKDCVVLG